MKPLSYLLYLKGNLKKTISLIISIAMSIFLIGSIHMFINNAITSGKATMHQYEHFSILDSKNKPISETLINEIMSTGYAEKIIRYQGDFMTFQGIAINSSGHIYKMDRHDIIYLLQLLEIEYSEVPENDSYQAILSDNLRKNNNLKIGDLILDKKLFRLNNTLKTNYYLGFVPTSEAMLNKDEHESYLPFSYGYLIIPKSGKMSELNTYLKSLQSKDITVVDLNYWYNLIDTVTKDVDQLFSIITVIVLISIGLGLGISTYVHYYQRRKEFGVISAIGYQQKSILLRISKEIVITSIIGLILGFTFLLFENIALNSFILAPKGVPLYKLDFALFIKVLIVPLFTLTFTLIPTWILLKNIDSVSIIEGVN